MVARRRDCPAGPGIARIVDEALAAGWTLAVASTSAEPSVRAVLEHAVGAEHGGRASPVFAGDVVPAKKPDPAIYLLAARAARRATRPRRSSSRTRATACSPRSAPACAAW